jgi:lipoprotein-anchoring transpeptidase ErfK/SrfK
MKIPFLPFLAACGLLANAAIARPPASEDAVKSLPGITAADVVRLQIYLDEQNFGPGKIDGQYGGFTRKSWLRYQESQGMKPVDTFDPHTAPLAAIDPVYVSYAITPNDVAAIGVVPATLAERAKNKSLPYTSLTELLGERFHVSVNFLTKLNAPHKIDACKPGDQVTVPNVVPPFQIDKVVALRQYTADHEKAVQAAKANGVPLPIPVDPLAAPGDVPASSPATPDSADLGGKPVLRAAPADLSRLVVTVNVAADYLEIRDGVKLVACFPITPGSTAIPTPKGEWRVLAKTLLPEFRWDESMLKSGIRSNNFYQLPSGPNNPVGIAWIALNKPGIGIHGTNDPDSIGRSASHGCIRLSNWDAFKVYGMLAAGTKVIIE